MKGKNEPTRTSRGDAGTAKKPVARRKVRELSRNEKTEAARRSRPIRTREVAPALDVSLPVSHPGGGYRIAETFVARNETAILDIVVPKEARVASWCCYARPAKGKKKDWRVVESQPDSEGRLPVPVQRARFSVWGFGEAPGDAEDGESVYRLHGWNPAGPGAGREVCWRLILNLEPVTIPVSARAVNARGAERETVPAGRDDARLMLVPLPA